MASPAVLWIRNADEKDIPAIIDLCEIVYPGQSTYTVGQLRGQISNFPDGQFVAIYEGQVVGYCASFRISGDIAFKPHTWMEITGSGYASRHDPNGEYLYGLEIFIHPEYRRLRIGQRLYNARKQLCMDLKLEGIVFGGRIPNYSKRAAAYPNPMDYIEAVRSKALKDSTLSFHLRSNFEILGVLPDYLPNDKQSMGYAVHLVWRNPKESKALASPASTKPIKSKVRVATIQYKLRKVNSFEEFASHVEYFVDAVADYKADFVVFPEMFTLQLLSTIDQKLTPEDSVKKLTEFTLPFTEMMADLSLRYNINIIGGSHPTLKEDGKIRNTGFVFLRDGSVHVQDKIHPTPNEKFWWNVDGGNQANMIMTDCGPIGLLICYDAEFPELARHLIEQGALLLFVPFCTDTRPAYNRVRYCCHARAVENQCYVALAGNVGNLPGVVNMDIQYAQSCILTPCDFPFARDGVAADTTPNAEMVALADLDMELLVETRNSGTVRQLQDRRFDIYSTVWREKAK
jgi:predicted amidohydrolase/GNAT superfamily N-acetyltransferase